MSGCKKPLPVCETGSGGGGEQIGLAECFPAVQSTTAPPGAQGFSALLRREIEDSADALEEALGKQEAGDG